ncbi:NEDD4-binding protein 2-like 1 [Oculina patagonica]
MTYKVGTQIFLLYFHARYEFDVSLLGEAHGWNQQRAKSALEKLQSPVIIDNTNTQAWEMKPYVSMALKYGYQIKFVEPDTSWKWNVKELARCVELSFT